MLKSIRDMFRTDEFIATASVFPNIDKDRLATELKLNEEGKNRGSKGQPEELAQTLDHVELNAIGRVESLRRRGLDNYETNRRVYSERLNLAVSARMQVETEANDAKSRFTEEVTKWKAMMVTPRERVQETYHWRDVFRKKHRLERPANPAPNWVKFVAVAFMLIVIESAGNAYLFAQKNTLGLLGGLMAAFLVSVGNVGVSTFLGVATRFINARNILIKVVGLFFAIIALLFAAGYNLGVAHFRDAVERVGEWRQAGIVAIDTLTTTPISLYTMESYVLLLLGALISVYCWLKGYNVLDPYPGYSKVANGVLVARDAYIENLEESIEVLAERRDAAVETLREANDEVHRNINDSVDALFGQAALQASLTPFLEQCDIAANYLLALYRDANKAARDVAAPEYFSKAYSFQAVQMPEPDTTRRAEAEAQVREVSEMVNSAIREIFDVFNRAVDAHYEIDELEGTHIERRQKAEAP